MASHKLYNAEYRKIAAKPVPYEDKPPFFPAKGFKWYQNLPNRFHFKRWIQIPLTTVIKGNPLIAESVKLGRSCTIEHNVTIGHNSVIGDLCYFEIYSFVSNNVTAGRCCIFKAMSHTFSESEIGDCNRIKKSSWG